MKLYLICIVFLPAVFGIFASSINDKLHMYENDCLQRSGATVENLEAVRKSRVIPENQQMKAFSKCMLEKYNVMSSDGTVNQNERTYTIPADTDSVLLAAPFCKPLSGSNAEDTARLQMNCYLESNQLMLALTPLTTS